MIDRRDVLTTAGGAAAFVAGAAKVRGNGVTPLEAAVFRTVNTLPRTAFLPVWAVMQLGSLGGALAVSGAVAASGHRELGRRMAVTGSVAWVGAKVLKQFVRRGRPRAAVDASRLLGREARGLGYPSGHAAVAVAVVAVAAPELPRPARRAAWLWALVVGPARMYVGAHLPLDVAGGVALGVAVGTAGRRCPARA